MWDPFKFLPLYIWVFNKQSIKGDLFNKVSIFQPIFFKGIDHWTDIMVLIKKNFGQLLLRY